jgi:putative copper export protein
MTFELLGVVARWAVFTGLLLAVGAVVFDVWILRGDQDSTVDDGPEEAPVPPAAFSPSRAAARLAVWAALLVVLGSLGRLAAEFAVFRDPFEPASAELSLLVSATSFGTAWMVQFGLGVLACMTFLAASRAGPARGAAKVAWWGALLTTSALAFTPAYSGHAAGSAHLRGLAIGSDVAHVIAGGAWLGTLGVIALVASRARSHGQPISADRLVAWVGRFSPLALICAGLIVTTGVIASWLHLDAVSSLWNSPYGQRLLIKVGVLGAIIGFGAYNWKQSRGRIAVSGDPARLPGSVRSELVAGLVILLVTAILVTTPPPGE